MAILRLIFYTLIRIARFAAPVILCYALIIVGLVVWMFQVKLARRPVFVYAAPFSVRVGDDLEQSRLLERVARNGYLKTASAIPRPGEWNRSGSDLSFFFAHSPFPGEGIVSGPVEIVLDWNRIQAIKLVRSGEETARLTIEPELAGIIPAKGSPPELCRPVPVKDVPDLLKSAVLLTEDVYFFTHHGIDVSAILEALKANIRAGRYVQGGSTVTQQLIRMTLLNPEKTLLRKVNEIFLALAADALYRKETILEAYLNHVYLGHWGPYPVRGVSEAARHFFGKSLGELDAGECALIAAMIRAPNIINPHKHPERAQGRRNMVLGLLLKAGKISGDQYEASMAAPIRMRRAGSAAVRGGSFCDWVEDLLPESGGIQSQDVITSMDAALQQDAEVYLKRFDDAGIPAHFLCVDPTTGDVKAYFANARWNGTTTNPEIFAPLSLLPAFSGSKTDKAGLTLTTRIVSDPEGQAPMTARQAFYRNRSALMNLVGQMTEPEKFTAVLAELGIGVKLRDKKPELAPVTPVDVARVYGACADLGKIHEVSPAWRRTGESPEKNPVRAMTQTKPAVLFLMNRLLLDADPKAGPKIRKPSVFSAVDESGAWVVAYRGDCLLVVRARTTHIKDLAQPKLIERFFRDLPGEHEEPPPPEGVVFRWMCVQSGLRAGSVCPKVIQEPFLKGTQPEEWCHFRHDPEVKRTDMRGR